MKAFRVKFRDPRIAGVLTERCYVTRDRVCRIYFRLSEELPLGWANLFREVWQREVYEGKANAGTEDGAVWVECLPEEMKSRHLHPLQNSVAKTNAIYRESQNRTVLAAHRQLELNAQAEACFAELEASIQSRRPKKAVGPLRSLWRKIRLLLGVRQ
jgi:hypothetical protein